MREIDKAKNAEYCRKYRQTEKGQLNFTITSLKSLVKKATQILEKLEKERHAV